MKPKLIIGWFTILISILTACFWAYWGIIENFHEGWYHTSLKQNIVLMLFQYLAPVMITVTLSLMAIFRHRIGAVIFLAVGIALSFFVNNPIASVPFIILGTLYWFSDFSPKKWKYRLIIFLPLLTLIICGIEPIVRLSGRINDGDFGIRKIEQNGISLVWAPQGIGWPSDGTNWHAADSICTYLKEDGLSLAAEPQHIWRLPTVEEAVKSMHRHGVNAKGKLNAEGHPEYAVRPDKETPLWNPNSKVIYWWTKTEIDEKHAYIIVYDGKIWKRRKSFGANYLGFRAVKETK
ncbi:MAG: hypothetical protein ACPGJS_17995 [Flammeovirgaceae bacterium]